MPINTTFTNGTAADAAQLNEMITAINALELRVGSVQALVEAASKSQLMSVAVKTSSQTFSGNGSANTIGGLAVPSGAVNVGTALNLSSGVYVAPITGSYHYQIRTLVSALNATSPRSKLTIATPAGEIILEEDTVFETNPGQIPNYRRTLKGDATVSLNQGQSIIPQIYVWGAATGQIFGDINTEIRVSRSIV